MPYSLEINSESSKFIIQINSIYWNIKLLGFSICDFYGKSVKEFYVYLINLVNHINRELNYSELRDNLIRKELYNRGHRYFENDYSHYDWFFDENGDLVPINFLWNICRSYNDCFCNNCEKCKKTIKYSNIDNIRINNYLVNQLVDFYIKNFVLPDVHKILNLRYNTIKIQRIYRKKIISRKTDRESNVLRNSNDKIKLPKLELPVKKKKKIGTENTTPRTNISGNHYVY